MERDWELTKTLLKKFQNDTIVDYLDNHLGKMPAYAAALDFEEQQKIEETVRKNLNLVCEHLNLMLKDGLIEGVMIYPSLKWYRYAYTCPLLTPLGHQTLEAMEYKPSWEEIKERVKKERIPIAIDLIISTAKRLIG